jgi:hypothetical protein
MIPASQVATRLPPMKELRDARRPTSAPMTPATGSLTPMEQSAMSAIEAWKAREQASMMLASEVATRLPQASNRSFSMSTGNQVATHEGTPR